MYDYDLTTPMTLAECQAMDRAALDAGPVGRGVDGTPFFLKYADVTHLLVHPASTTGGTTILERQGIMDGPVHQWFRDFFALSEPPNHTRLRALVSRTFHIRPIERMRAVARQEAEAALDRIELGADFDVFEDYAYRVPMHVICLVLGLEDRDLVELRQAVDDLGRALVSVSLSPEERVNSEKAIDDLYSVLAEVVAK